MARRQIAGRRPEAVVKLKAMTIALLMTAAAAGLGGCAGPTFGPLEEQLMFDRAQGYEIHQISPQQRIEGLVGYPRTDCCFAPPPGFGTYGRAARPVRPVSLPQAEPGPENDQQP